MREPDRVRRLAARLARNRAIDWDEQERDAENDDERDAIRQLRVVAAMAGFHRAVQAGDTSADLSVSVSMAKSVADPTQLAPLGVAAAPEIPAGSRWGHLEILERIGRGAFGEVYRARDTRLDRVVALKLLGSETAIAPDEVVREARLLAKVRHPNVVMVHGADRIDGRVGIWMEFLEGETLERSVRTRGMLDAREAALVGIDLCRALSAVHAAGIVHQDVKLGNVMRAEGGRIVLMDFGLGREARPAGRSKTRKISGTPLFMAPEVLRGSVADVRSDVYSLGVVLFALVTGVLPVEATRASDLLAKHDRGEVRRARDLRPDVPEEFAQVLDRALSVDVKERFATPGEAERALLRSLGAAVQSVPAPPQSSAAERWAIVALLLALAATATVAVRASRRPRPVAPHTVPLAELPAATLVGDAASGLFGHAAVGVGDIDGDGFGDVAIAAPQHPAGGDQRGKVYLYRGNVSGVETTPAWSLEGDQDGALFGWSLVASRTIMTGFPDLIVGAPAPTKTGWVRVYAGSKHGLSTQAVQTFAVDRVGTDFGYAIATGDVNHDGFDDLLIGEPMFPSTTTSSGRAYLHLSNGTTFAAEPVWTVTGPAGSLFGYKVSLHGDINHDGYADALIGAPGASFGGDQTGCGAAYVYLGTAAGLDSIPTILRGRQPGASFGNDCHIVGDLDGDGFADIAVGAEFAANGEQNEGVTLVYFGSQNGIMQYGEVLLESNTMGSNFGAHAGPLGDLDGDGCDDLFVGALRYQRTQPREGAAFVFAGSRDRRLACTWFRVRGKTSSWLGAGGGSAGDVNGDGFPDFIVASPSWDTDTDVNVGQVELFLNTRKR
jgi:serine/threonine-protein kinase